MQRPHPLRWLVVVAVVGLAACGAGDDGARAPADDRPQHPAPTEVPSGPLAADASAALDSLVAVPTTVPPAASVDEVGRSGDVRAAWLLVDLLRFHHDGPADGSLVDALRTLTGVDPPADAEPWVFYGDQLLGWDVPAPPGYFEDKRALYVGFDPTWAPFFDPDASVDWRAVTSSGVGRDEVQPLIDPEVVGAADGDWLSPDDEIVGVQIAGAARAYPLRVLLAHQVVTDSLGGRRIALPSCSLCGSVVGYYADETPEGVGAVDLRPAGLVYRGADLVYDASTESLIEHMTGGAVTGDLADAGLVLRSFPVVTTTWDSWRAEHPDTTVVSEDGGVGRVYVPVTEAPPDDWPVYPLGELDSRLDDHDEVVVGVTDAGLALAFPRTTAVEALEADRPVELEGVEAVAVAGGLTLRDAVTGRDIASHEAYWFAWSQSHPDTHLWEEGG